MAKSSEQYPRLHDVVSGEVLFVTVAEGKGSDGDPIHEVTYVCQIVNGYYELIGELYDGVNVKPIISEDDICLKEL